MSGAELCEAGDYGDVGIVSDVVRYRGDGVGEARWEDAVG